MFGSIISSIAGSLLSNIFAEDRQEDAQEFSSAQQAEAAAFNARQAEVNRNWVQGLSNTAHQREVADLKAAGLNPMLSMMRNGASTPPGGAANVSPTSAGIASPANEWNIPAAMQTASNISLQDATAEKTKAEAERARAETREIQERTPTHAVSIEQMQQNIEESRNRIQKIIQETSTSAYSAANLAQQTINLQEVIPQIRATIDNLKAHTRLQTAQTGQAHAQTAQAYAQTGLAKSQTELTGSHTAEVNQRVKANLPALEAALHDLERVQRQMQMPRLQQDESVHDSYLGSLSAAMRALNPFAGIVPAIPIRGTGAKPETPEVKFPRRQR